MVLLVLTQLVSPLTPHLAEEVFFRMPRTLREALAVHRSSKILEALGPEGERFANVLGLCGPLTSAFQVRHFPWLKRFLIVAYPLPLVCVCCIATPFHLQSYEFAVLGCHASSGSDHSLNGSPCLLRFRLLQVGWPRMRLSAQPAIVQEAEQLWGLLLLLRQDMHALFTRARHLQNAIPGRVSRVGSLNDLKLSITAPVST